MSRPRSHRLRSGACRDCGTHDLSSAPASCTACALESMRAKGHRVVLPGERTAYPQMWSQVQRDLQPGGWIKPYNFYIFVGFGDGGPLLPPPGSDRTCGEVYGSARVAQTAAERWSARYEDVWVVTASGSWDAHLPLPARLRVPR